MEPRVQALFIYPLKSAQGISLQEMKIETKGPLFDREWMLVNEHNNFISQRTHPQLSQLKTELTDSDLIVSTEKKENLKVDIHAESKNIIEVKIFSDITQAIHINKNYDQWFSDFLRLKVKLVRSPKNEARMTSGRNGPKTNIRFPDGYPLLLTNQATLDELNEKLKNPITMNRFRPNIVIEGIPANQEDQWTAFKIGNVNFLSVKASTRCKIIDINPQTGESSKEVTKTLSQYRTKDGKIIFGNNLSHISEGIIKIGEPLLPSYI